MKSLWLALVFVAAVAATEVPHDLPDDSRDSDRPLVRCKRPICDIPCPSGDYKLDRKGCMTCQCAGDSLSPVQELPCPIPMCAMDHECKFGFRNNEHGCQTCTCRATPCDSEQCPEGEVCIEKEVKKCKDCPKQPQCVGKPLCHRQDEIHHLASSLLMPGPAMFNTIPRTKRDVGQPLECDEAGRFMPTQCDKSTLECHCVDDRGNEIPETRSKLDKPECPYNMTRKLHGSFKLTHDLEDVTPHMNNIKQLAHQHLSRWLRMDEEFVNIVEITPRQIHIIQVHFVVVWDEKTDMATAMYHVQYLMLKGRCQIAYQGSTLTPDPKSMDAHHQYEPSLPDESGWTGQAYPHYRHGFMGWVHCHQTGIIAAVFGATMLILLFAIVNFARRRRMSAAFNHRRMDNYKENLAFSNQLYGKHNQLMPDDVKEPLPEVDIKSTSDNKTPDTLA